MEKYLLESVGYIAMFCILIGYFLLSTERLNAKSKAYHILNLVGSSLFVIDLSLKQAWASMTLNATFVLIASYAILVTCRKKDTSSEEKL